MFNTEPGANRWAGVQERPSRRFLSTSRPPPEAHEVQRGATSGTSPWLNTESRLAPDRTGLYWEAKQPGGHVRPASAGAPSHQHHLGAAVGCGYGRAPTATVHTSAGTALPTTAAQSPQTMRDGGRGRLQAYAFSPAGFLGHGSFLGGSTSTSAPASPLDRRALLYTRTAAGGTASLAVAAGGWGAAPRRQVEPQHPEPLPQRLLPATDLLDRLALLRRLAPATDPAPRPHQLQGMQGGSAGQPHAAYMPAQPAPQQPACGGIKRWAWDDSMTAGSGGGRPLTAGPAPGWQFCGEVLEQLPGEGLPGSTAAALVSSGGAQAALLVVHSPRQHQLCLEEEGEEEAQWQADDRTAGCTSRRAAFRPPGPLKHKFGNKPQPRPRSAPGGGGDKARVPGLRDCGCPKSPRASGVPAAGAARRGGSCATRQQQPVGSRRHLSWADAAPEAAAAPTRPHSARLAVTTAAPLRPALRQRLPDGSTETEPAIPEPASPRLIVSGGRSHGSGGSGGNRHSAGRQAADMDITTVEVTTGDGTTDVVVVSSPRIASGLGEDEDEVLTVAVNTSPTHGSAGSSEVVVVQQRSASPLPQPASLAPAAATSAPAATRLTVLLPSDGRPASYSIRADASSAAATGSASGSPIKAWRPAPQAQQAQQAQLASTTVSVDVLASPPRHAPAQRQAPQAVQQQQQQQPAAPADHLQQLAGEIRRREQSFNSLLAELEAIQQKCAKLSGPACAKASAAAGSAAGSAAATPGSSGVGLPRPRSGKTGPAAGQAGAAGGSGEKDWSWQSLMDFEATIREQQRKLVEQGVLPPDYL